MAKKQKDKQSPKVEASGKKTNLGTVAAVTPVVPAVPANGGNFIEASLVKKLLGKLDAEFKDVRKQLADLSKAVIKSDTAAMQARSRMDDFDLSELDNALEELRSLVKPVAAKKSKQAKK